MNLIWLPDAVVDLDKIFDYYAAFNPKAAAVIHNKIIDRAEILRTQPHIAPREPLLDDADGEFRSLLVADGKYKLVYSVENNTVVIIVIFSCRQNPALLRIKAFQRV
jgi:plasmid stabilization system protein ParE